MGTATEEVRKDLQMNRNVDLPHRKLLLTLNGLDWFHVIIAIISLNFGILLLMVFGKIPDLAQLVLLIPSQVIFILVRGC